MYKILFVDDESIYKLAIRSYIDWKQNGFTISETADNGAKALEYLKKEAVDAVITDLEMPVMNGVDLIKELRKQGFEGPILTLSNYSDYERVRGALIAGAFDYLIKVEMEPQDLKDALVRMREIIEQRHDLKASGRHDKEIPAMPGLSVNELTIKEQSGPELLRVFPSTVCIIKFPEGFSVSNSVPLLKSMLAESFKESEMPMVLCSDEHNITVLFSEKNLLDQNTHLPSKLILLCRQIGMVFSIDCSMIFFPGVSDVYDLNKKLSDVKEYLKKYLKESTGAFINTCGMLFPETAPLLLISSGQKGENYRESTVDIIDLNYRNTDRFIYLRGIKPQIAETMLLINQSYDNRITLEYLADRIGLNREYLCRLYLKETGINISQYVLDIRMKKASHMLTHDPDILVKEVALATGFSSQYAFSNKFKEYFGVSPAGYASKVFRDRHGS